jgi:hypothetical protein
VNWQAKTGNLQRAKPSQDPVAHAAAFERREDVGLEMKTTSRERTV